MILAPGSGLSGLESCLARLRAARNALPPQKRGPEPWARLPAAILRSLDYDITGRVMCLGFPGSGNVLTQSIIYRLLPKFVHRCASFPSAVQLVLEQQAMWKRIISEGLGVSEDEIVFLPQDLNHVSIRVTCQDKRFLDIYNANCPHWHTALAVPSHVLPSAAELENWIARGGVCVIVQRHPLDTIVSCAAKILRPPSRLLADLNWFRMAARTMGHYLDQLKPLAEKSLIVTYENLLGQPDEQIPRLAEFLGAEVSAEDTKAIWDEIGMRPLVSDQAFNRTNTHFFKPGYGKWMTHLTRDHAEIIEAEDLVRRIREWGYTYDAAVLMDNPPAPERPLTEDEALIGQPNDFFHFLFHAEPFFLADKMQRLMLTTSGLNCITNDPAFARSLMEMGARLADMQAAGAAIG